MTIMTIILTIVFHYKFQHNITNNYQCGNYLYNTDNEHMGDLFQGTAIVYRVTRSLKRRTGPQKNTIEIRKEENKIKTKIINIFFLLHNVILSTHS